MPLLMLAVLPCGLSDGRELTRSSKSQFDATRPLEPRAEARPDDSKGSLVRGQGAIQVLITDELGTPIGSAQLSLMRRPLAGLEPSPFLNTASGRWELRGVPPGEYLLCVEVPSWSQICRPVTIRSGECTREKVRVTQRWAFRGVVVSELGRSVAGVQVSLFGDDSDDCAQTHTGPDGRFCLTPSFAKSGDVGALRLFDPSGRHAERMLIGYRLPDRDAMLEMPRVACVTGGFVPPAAGQEIDVRLSWDIEWEDGSSARSIKIKTSADGSFQIADLPWEVPLRLTLELKGRAPVFAGPVTLFKGQILDIGVLATRVGQTLRVNVFAAGGQSLPNAWVDVSVPKCSSKSAQTDATGVARIFNLPKLPTLLEVGAEGFVSLKLKTSARALDVHLEPASEILGQIRRPNGKSSVGLTIQAHHYIRDQDGGEWVWNTLYELGPTDTDGRFRGHVEPGKYRIAVGPVGGPCCEQWVTVPPNDQKVVRIELPRPNE